MGVNFPKHEKATLPIAFEGQECTFAPAFQILVEGVKARAFPGAATAIVLDGKLVALHAVGRYTYDDVSTEVRTDCIWDLASISKVVATTAMAMLLWEREKLSLDIPVASILPEFGTSAIRARVTVGMLLTHSSGLPGYVKLFEQCQGNASVLLAALRLPLEAEPGTRAQYSDPGFIILGGLLERIAGESLDTFCEREIFRPLGMTETRFRPPNAWLGRIPPTENDLAWRQRIVRGEVNDENAFAMDGVAGHAGLFAPAQDAARFSRCMLDAGIPLFKPETVNRFTQRENSPFGTSRALGWDTPSQPSQSGKYFSPRSFGHLGFTGTSLWCDPDRRLGIVLLTNRTWPDRNSQLIKTIRPQFHDAVIECLGLT